jgi:hypothetical protein
VPAYVPCAQASSNRSHGDGLPSSSCSPSIQASHNLTLGTPDANGQATRGFGSARMQAKAGFAATPADEADVSFSVSIEDVRDKVSLASADAMVPEAVLEGRKAIWEIDSVQVLDGGADGIASTDPNDLFMVQGYFLP